MAKKISDGWHTICGYDVYIEDGKVLRGMKDNGTLPAYVYRWTKNGWTSDGRISVDAFRAGVRRETIKLA